MSETGFSKTSCKADYTQDDSERLPLSTDVVGSQNISRLLKSKEVRTYFTFPAVIIAGIQMCRSQAIKFAEVKIKNPI